MGSTAALIGQLVLSLGVVLLLLALLARLARKGVFGARAGLGNRPRIELLARQPLGRSASVAVVKVADRALVVGVTDARVQLLGETDPQAWEPLPAPETRTPLDVAAGAPAPTARVGQRLRAWLDHARERTVRR